MKNRRAKNIDANIINCIVQILDGWTGKLSWDLLIGTIAQRTSCTYTRQALHRHEQILAAFQLRKEYLSDSRPDNQRAPESLTIPEVAVLMDRYARLQGENMRIKAENERLLAQFDIWAYNAHTRGLDEDFLNRPLPCIDREVTRLPTLPPKPKKR